MIYTNSNILKYHLFKMEYFGYMKYQKHLPSTLIRANTGIPNTSMVNLSIFIF